MGEEVTYAQQGVMVPLAITFFKYCFSFNCFKIQDNKLIWEWQVLYFETQQEKFYLNSHRQTRPAQTDGGVGKAEQGSEQCDGCVQTFPMLTFNNKFQRETTPPKDGLPDPEADCGHDARLSILLLLFVF